ncbi:MAG: GntR family transcriptional regulator [Candidatus Methylomirabilota bacterium]
MAEGRTKKITERAYSQLKQMILYHKLSPGQRLQGRDLAEELGVSRTPVREALNRLENDGLVVSLEGKGQFVQRIDAGEVERLYDLRELLETYATCLAIQHATPQDVEDLTRMLSAIEALGESPEGRGEGIRLGIQFHERIAHASGNPFLHETLVRLLDRQLFYIWTEGWLETPAEREATKREHRAYLAALRDRSLPKARKVARTHVRRFKHRLLETLKAREAFYAAIEKHDRPAAPRPAEARAADTPGRGEDSQKTKRLGSAGLTRPPVRPAARGPAGRRGGRRA